MQSPLRRLREWTTMKDWADTTKKPPWHAAACGISHNWSASCKASYIGTHVLDVLQTAHKQNGPSVAAEARRTMGGVFELAIATLRGYWSGASCTQGLPANKTQHKRPDCRRNWATLRDLTSHGGRYETIGAFRLMWWTLCRPSESVEAKWSEFDLDKALWKISAERSVRSMWSHCRHRQLKCCVPKMVWLGTMRACFPWKRWSKQAYECGFVSTNAQYIRWAGKFSPHATRTTGSTQLMKWATTQIG